MAYVNLEDTLKTHGIYPKSVLHIGAHLAQELGLYKLIGCSEGVFVEADPSTFAQLSNILRDSPSFLAIEGLLSDVSGELVEFNRASNFGMSSSLLKPARHLQAHPEVLFEEKPIQLRTQTLNDLHLGIFDLVVLDVQGAELKVLSAGMESIMHAQAISIEVNLGNLYAGDCNVNQVIEFLSVYGFSPVSLNIGAHGWGDAIFIQNKSNLF